MQRKLLVVGGARDFLTLLSMILMQKNLFSGRRVIVVTEPGVGGTRCTDLQHVLYSFQAITTLYNTINPDKNRESHTFWMIACGVISSVIVLKVCELGVHHSTTTYALVFMISSSVSGDFRDFTITGR